MNRIIAGTLALWAAYAIFVAIWYPGILAAIFRFIGGVL